MGNNNSHSKRESAIIKVPNYDPTKLDQEKELAYYLFNNIETIDRSHTFHFMKRYLFQSNFSSPIEDKLIRGCKVLDVGCGTGTWLLDLSTQYENSYFFGIDIRQIYPQEIKPKNLKFIKADIPDGLPFSDNEFDFTHIDSMSHIITTEQWDFVLSELVRVTKPGGYIEIADKNFEHGDESTMVHKLSKGVISSCSKRNVDLKLIPNLDSKLELQPNITKVYRDEKIIVLGQNGGKIGLVLQDLGLSFYNTETTAEILSKELGISKEEYKNLIEKDLIEDINQFEHESLYFRFWAQKCNN